MVKWALTRKIITAKPWRYKKFMRIYFTGRFFKTMGGHSGQTTHYPKGFQSSTSSSWCETTQPHIFGIHRAEGLVNRVINSTRNRALKILRVNGQQSPLPVGGRRSILSNGEGDGSEYVHSPLKITQKSVKTSRNLRFRTDILILIVIYAATPSIGDSEHSETPRPRLNLRLMNKTVFSFSCKMADSWHAKYS